MKILHTADIHLGITTYGRVDPSTGLNTRLQDFRRAFEFMVEQAYYDEEILPLSEPGMELLEGLGSEVGVD